MKKIKIIVLLLLSASIAGAQNYISGTLYSTDGSINTFDSAVTFTSAAAVNFNKGTVYFRRNIIKQAGAAVNTDSAAVVLNGTATQQITGSFSAKTFTLDNSNGLSLTGTADTLFVNANAVFTAGKVITGSNVLKFRPGVTSTGLGSTNYVIGNLQKNVATGSNVSRLYEVGTANGYSPLSLTFPTVTTTGNILVSAIQGSHPNIATSNIDDTKKVNRYWTITNSGSDPLSYNVTANFLNSDHDGAANPANYAAQFYSGSAWQTPEFSPAGTPDFSSATFNGVNRAGDLVIGESKSILINTKLFIEGYYTGGGLMTPALYNNGLSQNATDVDNVTIELHASTGGLATVASATGVLQTNGSLSNIKITSGNGIAAGQSYYIVVKGTNTIPVWSASPVTLTGGMTYDFSNALSKAYGDNMKADGSVFMIYSGDVNGDGYIDAQDVGETDNDNANFASGVIRTDVNGDGFVDAQDVGITDNNNANFIAVVYPSGYAGTGRVQHRPPVKVPAKAVQKAGVKVKIK